MATSIWKKEKETDMNISPYAVAIFLAMQSKHIYLGTANKTRVLQRRAKNKAARLSRRKNR
jgi:hypothetical protein